MEKIGIVADLGHLRAFRIVPNDSPGGLRFHAMELDVAPLEEARQPVREMVSDQAGRFPGGRTGGNGSGMSRGESNGIEREQERQIIRVLAERIRQILLQQGACPMWNLAAPRRICSRLEGQLESRVLERLMRVESVDLTHARLAEIEERFSPRYAD